MKNDTKQAHTPGPWCVDEGNGPGYNVYVVKDQANDADPYCDMTIECHGEGHETNKANARLIAAAPELLEACKEFVRKVECGEARSTRSYKQMKEAIAKAEGKVMP